MKTKVSEVKDCPSQPNPSASAQADFRRPTFTAVQGPAVDKSAGRSEQVSRVLRVELVVSETGKKELRDLAAESARFCNLFILEQYALAKGLAKPEQSVFVREAGRLSGYVRLALQREAFAKWRKEGKFILAGVRAGVQFKADRALVCKAGAMNKGRFESVARVEKTAEGYEVLARLLGKEHGPPHRFKIRWKPQVDEYMRSAIDRIASGGVNLVKLSFIFRRSKVFLHLTYNQVLIIPPAGERAATLGPIDADGCLWLRIDGARDVNYTRQIDHLQKVKEHFGGIQRRLKKKMRRSGRGCWQDYRHALAKAGSFSEWAHGELHKLSALIVTECIRAGVGHLTITPLAVGDLPCAELEEKLKYKCVEAGIEIKRADVNDKPTERAIKGVVRKRQRSVVQQRKALAILKEVG